MTEDYWKKRCELAEKYIEESPYDPNINKGQMIAFSNWMEFKKFPIPVVVFSEARAEVCKRDECWKECVTWTNDCRCIKSCDLHKQT